jgi:hypothetical protein
VEERRKMEREEEKEEISLPQSCSASATAVECAHGRCSGLPAIHVDVDVDVAACLPGRSAMAASWFSARCRAVSSRSSTRPATHAPTPGPPP